MDKSSVFRQESLDRVSSPEQLDDYIKVAKPGVWIAIAAFIIIMASVIVWGVTGTIPKTLTINGLLGENNSASCYAGVTYLNHDITGCKAQIFTNDGIVLNATVSSVSEIPYSSAEIAALQTNDWIVAKLVTEDYAYAVSLEITDSSAYIPGTIANVTLITEEVKPISFIFN